jgi:Tfp pilus assembly protein PilV
MRGQRAAREDGFGLIEVVVSAAILVIVVLGTLSLIDNASGQSAENRSRTVSSQLAEQEQESLRALPLAALAGDAATGRTGSSRTNTVTVGSVSYTVTSAVQWLRDAAGSAPSCADDGVAEYLQLKTTVDDVNKSDGVNPFTMVTLLTPKAGAFGDHTGTVAIKLVDRSGTTPITGQSVSVSGPQAGVQATNSAGCAVFNYYPSGDYAATFSRAGYVDPLLRNPGQVSATVSDGAISVATQRFDRAASIRATTSPGSAFGITVANSGISNGTGQVSFPASPSSATLSSTQTATSLFPFSDGYSVYAGTCAANDPTLYGKTSAFTAISPGDVNKAVSVTLPTLAMTFKRSGTSGPGVSGATVRAFQTDAGCPSASYSLGTTASNGAITATGLPYGNYRVCVTDGSSYKQAFTILHDAGTGTSSAASNKAFTSTSTTTPGAWCP